MVVIITEGVTLLYHMHGKQAVLADDPCDHNATEPVQSQILAFDSSMKVQECSFLPLTLCSSKKISFTRF